MCDRRGLHNESGTWFETQGGVCQKGVVWSFECNYYSMHIIKYLWYACDPVRVKTVITATDYTEQRRS